MDPDRGIRERRERIELGLHDHQDDPFDGDPRPVSVVEEPEPLVRCGRTLARVPSPGNVRGFIAATCQQWLVDGECPTCDRRWR